MAFNPYEDFVQHSTVNEDIIGKYTNVLPHALINVWKEYGFGSFAKGFMKTINPDDYQELVNETYMKESSPIPVFATGLGDIIVWDEGATVNETYNYFDMIYYRKGSTSPLRPVKNLDNDKFFTHDLTNPNSYKNEFFWGPYMEALQVHGTIPAYDECYGYVPLLGMGGSRNVQNLKIVKIKEHIMLIKEMVGPIPPRG
jgi:hypothetical protein